MPPISIIEHLVLFKVRDTTDPSKIDAMLSSLRSLSSLHLVPYLAAGPIRRLSPAADFTHLLHARFLSKPDLAAYALHPSHLAVIRQNAPIIEDVFAADWVADIDGDVVLPAGSAVRFVMAKPREGTPAAEIVRRIGGVRVSKGVIFSEGRAKGYQVGFMLGYVEAEEMEAIQERIRDLVQSVVIVLDFVVPAIGFRDLLS